jgi:hypothetical protein
VVIQGRAVISAKDGSIAGNIRMGGLPYAAANIANLTQGLTVGMASRITLDSGYTTYGRPLRQRKCDRPSGVWLRRYS